MEQEEQSQKFTSSGSMIGRSHGKRSKEKKKVPQRGLGVAQLEKIRLEEQQKKISTYHNSYQSSSSSSSSSLNTPFVCSSNSTLRPSNSNVNQPSTHDHLNFPQELNPIWSLTDSLHRTKQYQQLFPSMVNVPTQSSLSSSQIEPPSNQIHYGNFTHISSEQEKMLGNKRKYSFLDNQPGSNFNFTFSTCSFNSYPSEGIFILDHSNSNSSELGLPSCPSNLIPEPNSDKSISKNNDFLTLSPPTTTSWPSLSSTSEIRNFETIPSQGIGNSSKFQPEPSAPSQGIPFYSFFPQPKRHNDEPSATLTRYSTSGLDENADLNLKL